MPRVQRGVRVLEDHLHVATDAAQLVLLEVRDVAPLELDRAAGGLVEAGHETRRRRLAAAGLADEAEGLALVDREADAVDGLDRRADHPQALDLAEREVSLEVGDLEQRLVAHRTPSSCCSVATGSVRWQRISRLARPGVGRHSGSTVTAGVALDLVLELAAGVEGAARGQVEQAGRRALDRLELLEVLGVRGQRLEQTVGVRVRRLGQHLLGAALLDAATGVHHEDVVGRLGHDREVVGDEDDRRAELLLEVVDEVEDLRLDGDVEGGRRLVGDEQLRVVDQAERDHGALAHTARELVRVLVGPTLRVGDADEVEHLDRALVARPACSPCCAPGRPRRSACRSCGTGAASSAGPGRPWPPWCCGSSGTSPTRRPTSSRPSSLMLPVICVRFGLCRPSTAMLLTDLPEPDSPTMARVRPRRAWYVEVRDGLDHALLGGEGDREVVDVEDDVAGVARLGGLGGDGVRGRGHESLTRGSMKEYAMSTRRFIMTTTDGSDEHATHDDGKVVSPERRERRVCRCRRHRRSAR